MSDREAFEKWAKDKCHLDSFEISGEKRYAALTANIMWEAWQAAQAQAVNQQLLESELTGEQWSAARKVFEQYANKLNSADKYEMASAYLDAAPQAIYAAIAAAQEQSSSRPAKGEK